METIKNSKVEKKEAVTYSCCTPRENASVCCTPSEANGGACCVQPADGSACC